MTKNKIHLTEFSVISLRKLYFRRENNQLILCCSETVDSFIVSPKIKYAAELFDGKNTLKDVENKLEQKRRSFHHDQIDEDVHQIINLLIEMNVVKKIDAHHFKNKQSKIHEKDLLKNIKPKHIRFLFSKPSTLGSVNIKS
ncbi:MAG: hypothetical protein WCP97_08825 [bacterium]